MALPTRMTRTHRPPAGRELLLHHRRSRALEPVVNGLAPLRPHNGALHMATLDGAFPDHLAFLVAVSRGLELDYFSIGRGSVCGGFEAISVACCRMERAALELVSVLVALGLALLTQIANEGHAIEHATARRIGRLRRGADCKQQYHGR